MKKKHLFYVIVILALWFGLTTVKIQTVPRSLAEEPKEKPAQTTPRPEEKRISLNFKDAELRDVLQLVADECNVNIAISKEVKGNVTVNLNNVTVTEALKSILSINNYDYIKKDNIIVITSREDIQTVTKIFTLENVDAGSLQNILKTRLSPSGEILPFVRAQGVGSEKTQNRSNVLIISDLPAKIEEMEILIKQLDTTQPQVSIKVHMIEANLEVLKEIGIDWNTQISLSGPTFPNTAPVKSDNIINDYIPPPKAALTQPLQQDQFYADDNTFKAGILSYGDFKTVLKLINTRGPDIKLLADPMITTLDNQPADIVIGDVVPIPKYTYNEQRGSWEITGYSEEEVGITLNVTPHITPAQNILMTLTPEVSEITGWVIGPSGQNEKPIVSTRKANTQVRVKNNETLVIGGLVQTKDTAYESKVPILGHIPILGYFFRYQRQKKEKTDLLIFISPLVLTEKNSAQLTKQEKERWSKEQDSLSSEIEKK